MSMKLTSDHIGHIVNSKLYLNRGTFAEVREQIVEAYGNLRGVKIVRLKAGTMLDPAPDHYCVPHSSQYEVLR